MNGSGDQLRQVYRLGRGSCLNLLNRSCQNLPASVATVDLSSFRRSRNSMPGENIERKA